MSKKYTLTGRVSIDFVIEIEADDLQEAQDNVEMMDVYCQDDMCATCWEASINIEESEPFGQNIWDDSVQAALQGPFFFRNSTSLEFGDIS